MADKTLELQNFTNDAKQLVASAQALADEQKHTEVTPLHLLVRLIDRDRGVGEILRKVGALGLRVFARLAVLRDVVRTGGYKKDDQAKRQAPRFPEHKLMLCQGIYRLQAATPAALLGGRRS